MAKKESNWVAIGLALRAAGLVLADLIVGGVSGWLIESRFLPNQPSWFILAGLIVGLVAAVVQLVR